MGCLTRPVFTRPGWFYLCLSAVLGMAVSALASAAQTPLDELLRPSGISDVTLSPSGTRVALLVKGRQSDSDLLVLERHGGQIQLMLGTRLGASQAIASYRWLSNDFLAMYFASPDEDFAQFAIANVNKHSIEVQDPLTQIIKTPWGDTDHILLSETGKACRTTVAARCLVNYDLPGGTSNRVSDPLSLQPVVFLAVSPAEIYAAGRDTHGVLHNFRLDSSSGTWRPIAVGSVALRRRALQAAQPLPDELVQQEIKAGMPGATPVWTEPNHQLVGLIGRAPQRPFLALDSRLDGLQALLEKQFPDARVHISGLNPALTQGMVEVEGADQPPLYLFFTDSGGLTEIAQLEPTLSASMLGRTHIERGWVDGMPVAVTLPPAGVTPIGVVVQPIIAAPVAAEEPLLHYDGVRQAFAQAGIIVVRALAPVPALFPSNAAGGEWRRTETARFQQVLAHVDRGLADGKPVCLYGAGDDGVLALAWSGLTPVDCTVAVNARLDPRAMTRPIQIIEQPRPGQRLGDTVTQAPSDAQLHRELPALYGLPGSDQLADPGQWVAQLPSHVMLGYDMQPRMQQVYAGESAGLRKAIRKGGKSLTFYADQPLQSDDIQSRERLLSAVVDYVRVSLTGGAAAATTAAR